MTETNKTVALTSFRKNRLGCLSAIIGAGALWVVLICSIVASLAGCAAGPGDRWEALSVAGTAHTSVFQNGLPRSGVYTAEAIGNGQARIYRAGQFVGVGTYSIIEPDNGFVRIDVSPNARIQITGQ